MTTRVFLLIPICISLVLLCTSTARATAWSPPIGIPAPSFGIDNVAPAVPSPWTTAAAGFYYVDATKTGATDSANPYGTPAKPRAKIPTLLPAGAVAMCWRWERPAARPTADRFRFPLR